MARKLRKGDRVVVISGSCKNETGVISCVYPDKDTALVDGVNKVVFHEKRSAKSEGGRKTKAAALKMSKLALIDPETGTRTRVGFRLTDAGKVRYAKKSGVEING